MKNISRAFLIPFGMLALTAVFSTITMWLWNALLPPLFGLPVLSWLQAAGLLVLCRVLFGGITGGFGHFGGGRRRDRENLFQNRWNSLSDEQRQHLAEEIQRRRGFDPRGAFDREFNSRKRDDAGTQENADSKKGE